MKKWDIDDDLVQLFLFLSHLVAITGERHGCSLQKYERIEGLEVLDIGLLERTQCHQDVKPLSEYCSVFYLRESKNNIVKMKFLSLAYGSFTIRNPLMQTTSSLLRT